MGTMHLLVKNSRTFAIVHQTHLHMLRACGVGARDTFVAHMRRTWHEASE